VSVQIYGNVSRMLYGKDIRKRDVTTDVGYIRFRSVPVVS